jgi:formylglycine-generating enzyme required for sulfatase activity
VRGLEDGLRDGGEDDGRRVLVNVADDAELVQEAGGRRTQGDAKGEASEAPGAPVTVPPFLVDRYEVTNARYAKFLDWLRSAEDPHAHCHADEPADKDHTPQWWDDAAWAESGLPVVGVDWFDAYAYARWAGLSLPTEAQWEAAARGTDGRVFPWGNEADAARANSAERLLDVDSTPASDWARRMRELAEGQSLTTYPGSYPAGRAPSGAYDMAGNVWEWCLDTYRPDAYAVRGSDDPVVEGDGWRVLRGGSWYVPMRHLRASNRWRLPPAGGDAATGLLARRRDVGFRCVRLQR